MRGEGGIEKNDPVLSCLLKISSLKKVGCNLILCKLTNILNKNIFDFESHPHPHNVNRVLAANSSSVPVEKFFIQKKKYL